MVSGGDDDGGVRESGRESRMRERELMCLVGEKQKGGKNIC